MLRLSGVNDENLEAIQERYPVNLIVRGCNIQVGGSDKEPVQIVGTQAAFNVMSGQRWKNISKEVKQYFLGYYGTPPAPLDPEIQKIAIGDEEPITCRPGEKIAPEMEASRKDAAAWLLQPEDALSWLMFPQVAKDFLPQKYARATKRDVGLNELVDGSAYPA